jgi:hypothetical protein
VFLKDSRPFLRFWYSWVCDLKGLDGSCMHVTHVSRVPFGLNFVCSPPVGLVTRAFLKVAHAVLICRKSFWSGGPTSPVREPSRNELNSDLASGSDPCVSPGTATLDLYPAFNALGAGLLCILQGLMRTAREQLCWFESS